MGLDSDPCCHPLQVKSKGKFPAQLTRGGYFVKAFRAVRDAHCQRSEGNDKAEVRDRRSGVRISQKTDDRGQMTAEAEGGGQQQAEIRGQRSDVSN